MPDRNHLAIGEVLSLLQAEFPDVTISKIRFLESQGLIDPERTPSGYRKFYDDDIARLRWILAQQRDHFLPLKVIKERLDEAIALQLPLDVAPGPGSSEAEPEFAAGHSVTTAAASRPETASNGGRGPRINVFTATATPRPDLVGDPGPAPGGPAVLPAAGSVGSSEPPDAATVSTNSDPSDGPGSAVPSNADEPSAGPVDGASEPATVGAAPTGPTGANTLRPEPPSGSGVSPATRPAVSTTASRTRRRAPAGAHPFGDLTSASFTIEELSAAVGMPISELEELERYGLLTSRAVSQGRRYGDDAVVVAKLAARFASFGVEARHLRMFKVAVDREIALYEQIVAPLARHRQEGGEVAAAQRWADLDQLGADLRDALFRRPLS